MLKHETEDDDSEDEKEDSHAESPSDQSIEWQKCVEFHILNFKKDRESYEEKWKEISVFVKYGMISEEKFYEKAENFALLKNLEGKHATLDEYKDKIKETRLAKYHLKERQKLKM